MIIHFLDPEKIDASLLKMLSDDIKQQIYCLRYFNDNQHYFSQPNSKGEITTREMKEEHVINFLMMQIKKQLLHYRYPCILEQDGEFKISYGKEERKEFEGTGPFKTLEEAENWFYKNGR